MGIMMSMSLSSSGGGLGERRWMMGGGKEIG